MPVVPSITAAPVKTPQRYDVYFTTGGARFYFRNPNHGIALSDAGLAWTADGQERHAAFANIVAIHLQTAAIGNSGRVIDQCKIDFADGTAVAVTNGTSSGLPDQGQTTIYRDFVRDLHARVAAGPLGTIRFSAGMAPWRYKMLFVTMIIAGLFLVVTPLGLAVFTGDLRGLAIAVGGGFLCLPFIRMLMNNGPRDYTPDRLPEGMLS